ncbi:MAG: hypothetical protein KIT33_09870 [Candidatus Kapabacteria bacterium]|nr:hypothetical protein [Ignavibacteriota bacterium]MCW5885264.1 hypothetical protein [Candidatus Kapabacteria bacterium]
MNKYILLLLVIFITISCADKVEQKQPEVDPMSELPAGHPPMSGMDALSELSDDAPDFDPEDPILKLSNIQLKTPEGWLREKPSSSMRIVQYSLKNNSEHKVVGFFFGQQDMVKENIDRWKNEFAELQDSKEEELVGGNVTMITLQGVYGVKHFPMSEETTPTPDYMVLAAIVKSEDGPYYFKVFAPASVLKKEIDNFKKFLNSYIVIS